MDAEEQQEFMAELYGKSSRDVAKEQLRAHLAAQGIEWDGEI